MLKNGGRRGHQSTTAEHARVMYTLDRDSRCKGISMNYVRKPRRLQWCYTVVIIIVNGCATTQKLQPSPTPSQRAVETPIRQDKNHPLKLGENYPKESQLLGEEGICVVRVEVDADGFV